MAASITATIGGATSNSYVEVAAATSYFEGRPNVDAWDDAIADARIRALITAARRLNDETYAGSPVYTDPRQALAWPRYGAEDRDGISLESDAIPQVVKDAQCELALVYLNAGTEDVLADSGLEAFIEVSAGPVAVTPNHGQAAGALPVHVRRILSPVLMSGGNSARLVLG